MKIYKILNKIQNSLLIPFSISSIFIVISEILLLLSDVASNTVSGIFVSLSELLARLSAYVFCYFFVYLFVDGKRGYKAFWSVICLIATVGILIGTSIGSLTFIVAIIISGFAYYCYSRFDIFTGSILVFVTSLLVGILLSFTDKGYNDLAMTISNIISGKGILSSFLFGLIKLPLSLFNDKSIADFIFYNSFGGSFFIDDSIVTGAIDLFKAGFNGESTSIYLSGQFLVLFMITGVFITLLDEIKGIQKTVLCFVYASSILSGNIWLFVLFVFFENPLMLLALSFVSSGCYVVSYMLQLKVGYIYNGSVFEMISNFNSGIYLISSGIVFICIGYFVTKLLLSKHSISDKLNIYYPSRLNHIVRALGGINNIIRCKNEKLVVRNPELVDKLVLECEIDGNIINSENAEFNELKSYL